MEYRQRITHRETILISIDILLSQYVYLTPMMRQCIMNMIFAMQPVLFRDMEKDFNATTEDEIKGLIAKQNEVMTTHIKTLNENMQLCSNTSELYRHIAKIAYRNFKNADVKICIHHKLDEVTGCFTKCLVKVSGNDIVCSKHSKILKQLFGHDNILVVYRADYKRVEDVDPILDI